MGKIGKQRLRWVVGMTLALLVLIAWASQNAHAIDTRPNLPAASGGQTSVPEPPPSQIVYEVAPGFRIDEATASREGSAKRMNLIGIISWGVIGAGVVVIVVVVISASRKGLGRGGINRTRYYRRKGDPEAWGQHYMDDNRYRKY